MVEQSKPERTITHQVFKSHKNKFFLEGWHYHQYSYCEGRLCTEVPSSALFRECAKREYRFPEVLDHLEGLYQATSQHCADEKQAKKLA